MTTASADAQTAPPRWWEHPALIAALVLASALPLIWPDVPPLVDLPGHMGRYRVQMEIGGSPVLQSYYGFHWSLIGNLGVDLLVMPLARLVGLETAVKLIVLAIPPLTAAGMLWVAREVHGRIPPTAFFALPFAYNFPFMFGFVNFALAMALAMLAFAFWLRLARLGRLKLRALLFVPISLAIWVAHTFGWGTLGVMAFSAELVRQIDHRRPVVRALLNTTVHCLALAPPILLMILWRSGDHVAGRTGAWFNWVQKFRWLRMALRDRWEWFDQGSLVVIALLLLLTLFWRKLQFSRNLAASAVFLALVFVLLPRIVFGSNYADMRLVPFAIAVAVVAIRVRPPWAGSAGSVLAVAGLLFFAVRTGATTASFLIYDRTWDRELAAVEHIPRGARLVSFVGVGCRGDWAMRRLEHLPALALVRKRAFSNDQWSMPGAQLLTTHYPPGSWFARDPSQQVPAGRCPGEIWQTLDWSLLAFPRDAFDYVWLIGPPPYSPAAARGLRPIWRSGASVLYQVVDRTQPVRPPGAPR